MSPRPWRYSQLVGALPEGRRLLKTRCSATAGHFEAYVISISQDQWHQLGKSNFESRMVAILREHFPDQTAPSSADQPAAPIPALMERAAGYGLVDEQSAAVFVLNTWLLGPDFDQRIPGLQQILSSKQLSPGTKADALTNFSITAFHELEQAKGAA
ncbi:MAG: hypothetical protein H7276_13060 [Caulobacter sp.]|nr:hypothetical protein [Vitreoscilla sp.]